MKSTLFALAFAASVSGAALAQQPQANAFAKQEQVALTAAYQSQLALIRRTAPEAPVTAAEGALVGVERSHGHP